jgi:hypothetical protein
MIPTNHEWVKPLIGLPWVSGARGPDSYDCWGLVWFVYNTIFDISVPSYQYVNSENLLAVTREIDRVTSGPDWIEIDRPIHGCAVGMSSNKSIHHVGIWLDFDGGVILHSRDHANVIVQSLRSVRMSGIQNIIFYKHRCHER